VSVLAVIPSVATCLPLRSQYCLCRFPCFEQPEYSSQYGG